MKKDLEKIRYLVLDMDGTVYLGDRPLDGAIEYIKSLKGTGIEYLFFTNNSSKNSNVYVEKLARMGLEVEEDKIITSGMVTADYILKKYHNPRVYLLGTKLLVDDFTRYGIELVQERPDLVVAGFDTTIDYEKLTRAATHIRQGVPFIATHMDYNCPIEGGFIPDCGAICAFLTASTAVKPKYIGKPNLETLEYVMKHLHCSKEELAFVGDRLYTDIAIGFNHGVTSVLVLTGESQLSDVQASQSKPDLVIDRLADLKDHLK